MRCRHLAPVLPLMLLATACHLNLLLDGEGYGCTSDENCPEGMHCGDKVCLQGAGDAAVADAVARDTAAVDRIISDQSGTDTRLADSARPDHAGGHDTHTGVDAGGGTDVSGGQDTRVGVDSAVADAGSPCDNPSVSTVVSGLNKPARLVLANGSLYWTSFAASGAIMKRSLSTGATTLIGNAPGSLKPYGLAVDATHVYVISSGGTGQVDAVHRFADAASSTAELIADGLSIVNQPFYLNVPSNIFLAGGKVFWLARGSSQSLNVCRHDPSVQAANVFDRAKTRGGWPNGIVRLGDDLFVAEDTGYTGLTRHPLTFASQADGTPVSSFSEPVTELTANSTLIFLAEAAPNLTTPGAIVTVDPQSTLIATLVAEVGPSNKGVEVLAMIADDSTLYYATESYVGGTAQIHRVVLPGPTSTPLAPADRPAGLAMDADYLYWTEYDLQEIRRYPRCP
ncbi:MAG: hypothetical protein ABIJ09_21760 [Pseudomonadota bacterium]